MQKLRISFNTGTKLYCLVTEVQGHQQLAQDYFAAVPPDQQANRQPLD